MRIVVNDAVTAASRRERAVRPYAADGTDPLSRLVDPGAGPQELVEEAEERRRVWDALAKLPPAQRAVIVQRYYLGMSEAEMAEGGVSPPGTIKSRLNAARGKVWIVETDGPKPDGNLTLVSTLHLGSSVRYRVVGEPGSGLGATPAEPSLEDGYVWLKERVSAAT